MKAQLAVLFFSLTVFSSHAQLTYVPDDVFEAYIETYVPNAGNGNISDNYVNTAALQAQTSLNLAPAWIPVGQVSDLTGINDFTNLTSVGISNQAITTLDLSYLYSTFGTPLIPFGVVVNGCQFLTTIDMPQVTYLSIDIANNQYLQNIFFQDINTISMLFRVWLNPSLEKIDISNTAGTSMNTMQLFISSNSNLSCLNLKNGGCSNYAQPVITGNGFNNPNIPISLLTCVTVDNPSIQSLVWAWSEYMNDPTNYSYSTNCSCSLGLEETTQAFTLSPNPVNDLLNITVPSSFVGEIFHVQNAQGDEVQHGVLSSEQHAISVEQLPAGVYVLTIDGLEPKRVVKL
jgi:hypothetical protein